MNKTDSRLVEYLAKEFRRNIIDWALSLAFCVYPDDFYMNSCEILKGGLDKLDSEQLNEFSKMTMCIDIKDIKDYIFAHEQIVAEIIYKNS